MTSDETCVYGHRGPCGTCGPGGRGRRVMTDRGTECHHCPECPMCFQSGGYLQTHYNAEHGPVTELAERQRDTGKECDSR